MSETLDIRNVAELPIKVLAGKSWDFELTGNADAPVLTAASATMVIKNSSESTIQSLSVGSGITITGVRSIQFSPASLVKGRFNYKTEIIPLSGATIRIQGYIESE